MTQLPFEDLPEKPADPFDAVFWPAWPLKVDKKNARKALKGALRRASLDRIMAGVRHYISDKPPWKSWKGPAAWLNGDLWEDGIGQPTTVSPMSLSIIAAHVKRDFYKGEYDRDVLQRCVDAGLLTVDEMEAKS